MWAWVVPILINFLMQFLQAFLENWLKPEQPKLAVDRSAAPNLMSAKQEFVDKFYWKFWYGPKRLVYAAALYDQANQKFVAGDYLMEMNDPNAPKDICVRIAASLCNGLKLEGI